MADRTARGGTLVLGGGFAGSYVARLLRRRGATVVSPENYMLYTPMLPEAASGTLEPRHVVVPLRIMAPHAELLLGRATGLDTKQRRVRVETEEGLFWVRYTNLVVALGAVARVLPIPGLADAIQLRNHVLRRLVTRTYHLLQLPTRSRKVRVVVDWTVALFLRRDIAELGGLGHPRGLRDPVA